MTIRLEDLRNRLHPVKFAKPRERDWLPVSISLLALCLSATVTYFNLAYAKDDFRVAIRGAVRLFVNPDEKTMSAVPEISMTFINSGTRQIAVSKVWSWLNQISNDRFMAWNEKYKNEPDFSRILYACGIGSDFRIFEYEVKPLVVKPSEIVVVDNMKLKREGGDREKKYTTETIPIMAGGIPRGALGTTEAQGTTKDVTLMFQCLEFELTTPDSVLVRVDVPWVLHVIGKDNDGLGPGEPLWIGKWGDLNPLLKRTLPLFNR